MLNRIPHTDIEVITGQETTNDYLKMQKLIGRFYFKPFFKILAEQKKTGQFLEIGSGSGYQTAEIARRFRETEIMAIEASDDMIAVASTYLAQQNLQRQVQFVRGIVEDETLIRKLGEFDLVYSTFSLHHWNDPVQAFKNLYGTLKQKGVLLIHDFERSWLACQLPLPRGMAESIRASYTQQEIKTMLEQAEIDNYTIQTSFPYLSILIK